ncbi:MAG TPA: histidine kinase dimerization/phospho-acceptor domain-containing protein, partial [Streptosporangiaceae bacterium]
MRLSPAAKVAAGATAVIAVIYILGVIILNVVVSTRLAEQNDDHLTSRLAAARANPALLSQRVIQSDEPAGGADLDNDDDGAPAFLWALTAGGSVSAHSPGAPALSAGLSRVFASPGGLATTVTLGSAGRFRLNAARYGDGWLVAGQSLTGDAHTERLLLYGELAAGPFLLLAMFGGSLVVGLRSLAPVEQSRRRQLEFTADASHELRTPLSVIRAEADVALSSPRE